MHASLHQRRSGAAIRITNDNRNNVGERIEDPETVRAVSGMKEIKRS